MDYNEAIYPFAEHNDLIFERGVFFFLDYRSDLPTLLLSVALRYHFAWIDETKEYGYLIDWAMDKASCWILSSTYD